VDHPELGGLSARTARATGSTEKIPGQGFVWA